ncbi:MAG: pantoate--beta-alanine ligase [Planctomycetaceae bacterium]
MSTSRPILATSHTEELRDHVRRARRAGQTVGCVPTMGALHAGHVSLMQAARNRCDFNVVTIFVNPTQFAPTEDLAKYPRPVELDLIACREAGMDLVFMPQVPDMYPAGFCTWVTVDGISSSLEGTSRPTHFRGVTTIVMKLFQLVQPDVAFFGSKDYQQQLLIRRMVQDLDVPVEIVTCPTIREADGLAMSSRNVYLSSEERKSALSLSAALQLADDRLQSGETDIAAIQQSMLELLRSQACVEPDYAVLCDAASLQPLDSPHLRVVALVAAKVGATRLIDNRVIELVN